MNYYRGDNEALDENSVVFHNHNNVHGLGNSVKILSPVQGGKTLEQRLASM